MSKAGLALLHLWPFYASCSRNWLGRVSRDGFEVRLNLRGARGIGPEVKGWFIAVESGTLVQVAVNLETFGSIYLIVVICCAFLPLVWLLLGGQPTILKVLETLGLMVVLPWLLGRQLAREREATVQQLLTLLTKDMGLDAQVPYLNAEQREWLADWRENARWAAFNSAVR